MRVAVTGATGYIGTNLCRYLMDRGVEVIGHSRSTPAPSQGFSRWHTGSLLDTEVVSLLVVGADAVVHLGAQLGSGKASAFHDANARTTASLAWGCLSQPNCKLVLASTIEVYDNPAGQAIDEEFSVRRGRSVYADSKIDAERMVAELEHFSQLNAVCMRIGMTYSLDSPFWARRLFDLSVRGQFNIVDGGHGSIFPVHVDDLCQALYLAISGSATGTFNIVHDEGLTWKDWQQAYQRHFERPVGRNDWSLAVKLQDVLVAPRKLFRRSTKLEVMTRRGSILSTRAKTGLGWIPARSFAAEVDHIVRQLSLQA